MYEEQFRRRTIWAAFLLAALACALFLLLNPRGYRALLVARLFRTNNPPIVVPLPKDFQPRLPPGFTASVLARGFDEPRWLAVAPNGDLFVAESATGKVIVLHFSVSKDRVQSRQIFADHLLLPFGIAFHEDFVYVALTNRVVRFHYDRETSRRLGEAEAILDLPGLGYNQHWTRSLAFSPDGNELFVSVGSRTNVSIESDPRRAAILVLRPDGGGMRVYANGLRNAVGIAFSPASGDLWATVNERDDIAEDIPSDFFTHVVQGGFYGWPYAYLGPHIDDRVAARPDLVEKAIVPDLLLGAHVAPLHSPFMKRRNFPRCIGTELSWLNMDRGIARLEVATKSFSFPSRMVSRRENPVLSFPVLCLIPSANRSTAVWLVSQSLATDRFWSRTTRTTLFGAFLIIRNPRPLFPDGKYCSCTSSGRNSDRCCKILLPPSISR